MGQLEETVSAMEANRSLQLTVAVSRQGLDPPTAYT